MVYRNGDIYNGDFAQGKEHGNGQMMFADPASEYVGSWSNGMPSGMGIMKRSNGGSYEGHFLAGRYYGQGTLSLPDGTRYRGQWSNDALNGFATVEYRDGRYYRGTLSNGKRHGSGFLQWADGSSYEGTFVDHQIEGVGVYRSMEEGSVYHGSFVNGQASGFGIRTFGDGHVVMGEWRANKLVDGFEHSAKSIEAGRQEWQGVGTEEGVSGMSVSSLLDLSHSRGLRASEAQTKESMSTPLQGAPPSEDTQAVSPLTHSLGSHHLKVAVVPALKRASGLASGSDADTRPSVGKHSPPMRSPRETMPPIAVTGSSPARNDPVTPKPSEPNFLSRWRSPEAPLHHEADLSRWSSESSEFVSDDADANDAEGLHLAGQSVSHL